MIAAALVLAVSMAPVQGSPPQDLAAARQLIDSGQARAAIEKLRALPADPDADRQARVAQLLGVAYYHADEPAKAFDTLLLVVDRLPRGSLERQEAQQVLGLSGFAAGRYADAIPHLEATRKWAAGSFELAYALSQAYIHTQRFEDARRVIASTYAVDTTSAAAHLLTAQALVRLELNDHAVAELDRALASDPRTPGAHYLLGQIALFRGDFPKAIALTQRELAVNPAHAAAWSQLGDAYTREARWDDAVLALQKSVWLNPYYSAPYVLLGRAYMKKDLPVRAEAMLRRAIQYDPNNRSAHYLLAQVLQQTGRAEEAKREFELAERLTGPRGQ